MISNTLDQWGLVSKLFHWVMGVLLISMLGAGLWMEQLPPSDMKWFVYGIHKSTGLMLLLVVVLRLGWRLMHKIPAYPTDMPCYQKSLSSLTVWALYGLMFAMPVTGFVMSAFGGHPVPFFGLFTISAVAEGPTAIGSLSHQLHTVLGWSFVALLVLHVLGALYHHWIRRDALLRRMWFFYKMPAPSKKTKKKPSGKLP
ncbi:MAG: cytochrome b [Alphaproteobacteria bacterium]